MTDHLPPTAPEWDEFEKTLGGPSQLDFGNAQASREQFNAMFGALAGMWPPKAVSIHEEVVHITPTQSIKVYSPASSTKNNTSPLPVGLYIHSGGLFAGAVEFEDGLCRSIVQRSEPGIILFSPHYRLAPEDPFPAGLDDVCAAYEWMQSHAARYGGDAARKAIMGGSAGGYLGACVAVRYATDPVLRPAAVLLGALSSCDPRAMPEVYKRRLDPAKYRNVPMFNQEAMAIARGWYDAPPAHPLSSPLLHPDLKHLPRTYVTAGTNDATYQETIFFYEECRKHGVCVELEEFVGWPHFFWIVPGLKGTDDFLRLWCQKMDEYLAAAAR